MEGFCLDSEEIRKYEQIREPLLMLDHVTNVIPGKSASGYKVFQEDEWFFKIHFPGEPNVPGAFQLEALAQLLTVAVTTLPGLAGKTTRFISFEMKCKREILPGEKMDMEVTLLSWRRGIAKGTGRGMVNGEIACEAEMVITIPDILNQFLPGKRGLQ